MKALDFILPSVQTLEVEAGFLGGKVYAVLMESVVMETWE